jgi:hypothetical protein
LDDVMVPLLDESGQWTHRDRHQHHRFEIHVPDRAAELRIRFRWGPLDMGSEHEQNQLALSLFGPRGFRGAAAVGARGDQEITIGESFATPGSLAGPIPSGAWSINVDSGEILNDGAETGHLTWHLEATARIVGSRGRDEPEPGSTTESVANRRPPAGGERWYRGDLHAHTVHSDGVITVEDRVRGAVERGLDFLAITDHNTISQAEELHRWPDLITPIRGSEVTTFHGHINCLGLAKAIDWRDDARGRGAASIVDQAHRQDALVSINHPNAFGDPWCTGCHWDFALVDLSTIDAIEVWNGRWAIPETDNVGALAFWTDLLDAGLRPTGVSGTDSHSAEEDQYPALPMTYVHAGDRGERSILDGIRRGRVFLSSGPLVSFRARGSDGVDVVLPGDQLPADGTLNLTVDVERLDGPATLWYVTSGSTVPLGECGPAGKRLVEERLVASKWWRLELRTGSAANGDLLALTNPVFVRSL